MKAYYQPRGGKKGAYTLRDNTYRRMWYLISDYPYFKALEEGRLTMEEFQDERNSSTETEAISSCNFEHYIQAIEAAQKEIPDIYIDDVMAHIAGHTRYADLDYVCEQTLKKWVQRFIWHVAKQLGEV